LFGLLSECTATLRLALLDIHCAAVTAIFWILWLCEAIKHSDQGFLGNLTHALANAAPVHLLTSIIFLIMEYYMPTESKVDWLVYLVEEDVPEELKDLKGAVEDLRVQSRKKSEMIAIGVKHENKRN
ncbi:hypothetical protein CCACVL1_29830, partial [Corchorus capsularis]